MMILMPTNSDDFFSFFIFDPKNYLQSIFCVFGVFLEKKLPDNFQNRAGGGEGGQLPVWKK